MTTINGVPRELLADLLSLDREKRIPAERHLYALLAEQPQAGAGQCQLGYGHAGVWCGPHTDCWLDPRPKHASIGAPHPAARHDQGDEVRRLREALAGLVALYEDDEGCRSLPQYKAARAALTHSQQGEEE